MAFKDIRKSRKWLSPQEIRIIIAFLIFLSALLALNHFLARTLVGGEWLLIRWNGLRTFLGMQSDASLGVKGWRAMPDGEATYHTVEPNIYGGEIARRVQQMVVLVL